MKRCLSLAAGTHHLCATLPSFVQQEKLAVSAKEAGLGPLELCLGKSVSGFSVSDGTGLGGKCCIPLLLSTALTRETLNCSP